MKFKVLGITLLLAFNGFAYGSSCIEGTVRTLEDVKKEKLWASISLKNETESYEEFKTEISDGIEFEANVGKIGTYGGAFALVGPVALAPWVETEIVATGITAAAWSVIGIAGFTTAVQNLLSEAEIALYTFLFGNGVTIESYLNKAEIMLNSKIECKENPSDYYKLLETLDHNLREIYRIGDFDVNYWEALLFANTERLTIRAILKTKEVKVKVLEEFLYDLETREKFLLELQG